MNSGTRSIINASAHNIPLPTDSVHVVCTSPPYYSLRRYSGEQEIDWPAVEYKPMPGLAPLSIPPMRAALGLEPTPDAYIGHLILVFRDVARVMRSDGACWIVIGDSFASGGRTNHGTRVGYKQQTNHGMSGIDDPPRQDSGMDDGNLMFIPHRLALALQGDGWTIRNDVVWVKVAPMPESIAGHRWERHKVKVSSHPFRSDGRGGQFRQGSRDRDGTDGSTHVEVDWSDCPGCPTCEPNGGYVLHRGSWRHTRAHEYVLMCTRGMGYFANGEAVRETSTGQRGKAANFQRTTKDHLLPGQSAVQHRMDREPTSDNGGRNPRSVLTPSPESFSGSHYAVFPTSLIAPLIRATCPSRCCPVCGAGWAIVKDDNYGELPLSEMQSDVGEGCIRDGQPESRWATEGVQGMRQGPPETCVLGAARGELATPEGQSSAEYRESPPTGKAVCPDKTRSRDASQGRGEIQGQSKESINHQDEGFQLEKDRERSEGIPYVEQSAPGKTDECPREIYGGRLVGNIGDSRQYVQVLQEAIFREPTTDNRPRDTIEQGRFAQPGQYRGSLPSLQFKEMESHKRRRLTYRPTCTCNVAEYVPGTCLDPFVGSGTTLAVAAELGLNAIGIDLSMEYLDEHAKPRGMNHTPSKALEGLPLFAQEAQ